MRLRWLMWVLWPAFLMGGAATAVVFSVVDPGDLSFFGQPVEASRQAIYTVGFLVAWLFCALSSGLTLYTMPVKLSDTEELE
ncbi:MULTISPECIES: hypothetical protein [unclassified Cupriavidus]|uniref:hypothetical protein n=1 Tax=unclassified Cupriavidus TaxID=2640874 RepID=UPI001C00180D|nr:MULTISPECIES: hypothetical protein [unclassified Cupriavidus]MCA3193627.1 hypothetical protein [Cupriavidus sp.]MCA3200017.1 hypothetical protein [Cupriavidus sp.]MCA3202030.1 hypothetical protein [Cupriavidus sp.]MCA3205752.1 hypothetical protein [Cupriavidus sp.]QWE93349.1 hypothetical protein KLP38_09910 [Cupriavidus sp. EM10]